MKKQTQTKKRIVCSSSLANKLCGLAAAAMLVLTAFFFFLQAFGAKNAEAAPVISEDHNEITVLSVTVNVSSEMNEVFTELVLKNEGAEDQTVTFPLPMISGGVDPATLYAASSDGERLETPEGNVTIEVPSGDFTGLTYCYKTKRPISYDRTIAFDLRQISDHFYDRIGMLIWNLDMAPYEIPLVRDIQPVYYFVNGNRITVSLNNFRVSPLLDRVSVTRITHRDLMERIEAAEESGSLSEEEITKAMDFLENYRKMYQDPSVPLTDLPYIDDDFYELHTILKWTRGEYAYTPGNLDTIAFNTQICEEDPVVYAILLTHLPELEGKTLVAVKTPGADAADGEEEYFEYVISPAEEETILRTAPTYPYFNEDHARYRIAYLTENDLADPAVVQDYLDALHVKAIIRSELVLEGSEIDKKLQVDEDGWTWYRTGNFSYGGSNRYTYSSFATDLIDALYKGNEASSEYTLIEQPEPLSERFAQPIITQYWGRVYPVEEVTENLYDPEHTIIHGGPLTGAYVVSPFDSNSLLSSFCGIKLIEGALDHEIPKEMRGEHEAEWMSTATHYGFDYSTAIELLNLSDESTLWEAARAAAEKQTEQESETEKETETEQETETEKENEKETETEKESETDKESEKETETASEIETDTVKASETESTASQETEESSETKVQPSETKMETEEESESETNSTKPAVKPQKGSFGILLILAILLMAGGAVLVVILLLVLLIVLLRKKKQ